MSSLPDQNFANNIANGADRIGINSRVEILLTKKILAINKNNSYPKTYSRY